MRCKRYHCPRAWRTIGHLQNDAPEGGRTPRAVAAAFDDNLAFRRRLHEIDGECHRLKTLIGPVVDDGLDHQRRDPAAIGPDEVPVTLVRVASENIVADAFDAECIVEREGHWYS